MLRGIFITILTVLAMAFWLAPIPYANSAKNKDRLKNNSVFAFISVSFLLFFYLTIPSIRSTFRFQVNIFYFLEVIFVIAIWYFAFRGIHDVVDSEKHKTERRLLGLYAYTLTDYKIRFGVTETLERLIKDIEILETNLSELRKQEDLH